MVNLVNIESVSKAYGTRTLLDGVSLGLAEGDTVYVRATRVPAITDGASAGAR